MKKWISVILAVVTLCTLCTVLPAGAATPYAEYAYVYENFEDGQAPSGATLVEPGVGDTGYAVRRTITAASEPLNFPLNLSGVAEGDVLKLSAWVRPKAGATFSAVNFTFYGYDENIDLASYTVSAPVANVTQNEWSYVETKVVWENIVMDTGYPVEEIGALLVEAALPEGATDLTYDIDDIIVEPTQAAVEKVYPNLVQNDMIDGQFEGFSDNANIITRTGAGWYFTSYNYAAKAKKFSETDPRPTGMATTSNTYMHLPLTIEDGRNNTSAAVGYGYAEFGLDKYHSTYGTQMYRTLEPGHAYKVAFWTRPNANTQGTTTYNPVFVHDLSVKTITDANGPSSSKQEYVISNITVNGGQWNYVEFYFLYNYKTITATPTPITIRLKPTNGTVDSTYYKVKGGSFDFDEIQILDLGMIANGDFEMGQTANVRSEWAGAKAWQTQSVFGWTPTNATGATLSQSTVVRPGQAGHSMKVSVATAGTSVYQAVGMENGQKYKISFWAKGDNIPDAGLHLMVSMQRSIGTASPSDSYDVPNTQFIYGPDAADQGNAQPPLVNRKWTLTSDWQYYEFIYDNTFPLKSGLTQANANTFPRVPWLQMTITQKNNGAGIPAGTAYYLDDMAIEPYDPSAPPVDTRKKEPFCSAIEFSGSATVGQPVGVTSYTYTSEKDIPQATSVMRVMKKVGTDQWAQVAVKSGTTSAELQYTLPADLAGADIRVEFIPIDEENHFGTISAQEYTVNPEVDAVATFSGDGTTTPVSVSVDIANSAATAKNITVILALYDANNTMLDIKSVSVSAANGLTTVPTMEAPTALTAALTPTATTARVYVLDGTSLDNAGSIVWKLDNTAVPVPVLP